ncbi:DUF4129 domain-containing protein [Halobaculum sp. MBLA0147]|uniref:DUF4129 domain-containing protein n=1 Tax=Halobaculum sp. MBLA0147 TaxID=3079934 RepID=UPI0035246B38
MVARRTVLVGVLAVLAVVALGLAAAALETTVSESSPGGSGVGDRTDVVGGGDLASGGLELTEESGRTVVRPPCLVVVEDLGPRLLALGAAVYVLFLWRDGSHGLAGLAALGAVLPLALLVAGLTQCTTGDVQFSFGFTGATPEGLVSGGGATGIAGGETAVTTPTLGLGLLLAVAVLASVVLLFVATGDDERPDAASAADPDAEPDGPDSLAAAAGVAADRLEDDAAVDNTVYRAWHEMTAHLDVDDPHTTTPAEFATAATEAGVPREDVTALTELFEEVRYGDRDVTPERRRRAVAALRRVEATDAPDDRVPDAASVETTEESTPTERETDISED